MCKAKNLIHHLEIEVSVPISVQSAEHVVAEAHSGQPGREEGRELGPLYSIREYKNISMLRKYLPEHAAPGVVVFEHVIHIVQLGLAVLGVVNLVMVGRISESRSKAQK